MLSNRYGLINDLLFSHIPAHTGCFFITWHFYLRQSYNQIMLNIRLEEREGWVGAFPEFPGISITCNLSLLPTVVVYYHSRLAQSWAADGKGFSKSYSSSPILAAHCPWPEYTGSMGKPAFVTAYPRWKNNGGRHQFAYSGCKVCLITYCTAQAANFSAIAGYFIPILCSHHAPPSKFQLFGYSKWSWYASTAIVTNQRKEKAAG